MEPGKSCFSAGNLGRYSIQGGIVILLVILVYKAGHPVMN